MAAPGFLFRTARGGRRLTAVSAMTAALGAASLAAVPAALAAPATAAHAAVTRTAASPGHRMLPARAVRCKIGVTLRFPHPVTAIGSVKCSGQVQRITVRVQLFRNSSRIKNRSFTRTNLRGLAGETSVACRAGSYWARAVGKVVTRGGHVLSGQSVTRRVRVRC